MVGVTEPMIPTKERAAVGWRHSALRAVPLASIIALAAATRLAYLDADSLWFDTAHSVAVASNPEISQVIQGAITDYQSPLYFVILHYWLGLAQSDFWVRLLSALFGVGTVGLTYLLGKVAFSRRAGLMAALIAALTSYQVYYSQYPRAYILLAFLATAAAYSLYRALSEQRLVFWASFTLAMLAALYTHPYALFLLPAQGLFTFAYGLLKNRRPLLPWAASQLALLIGLAPWLPIMAQQFTQVQAGADNWIAEVSWQSISTLHDWLWFRTQSDYGWELSLFLRLGRFFLLGLMALWLLTRKNVWEKGLIIVFLLAPVAAAYLTSAWSQPIWVPRYFVFISPFFCLLLGAAIANPSRLPQGLPAPLLSALAIVIIVGMSLPPLYSLYHDTRFRHFDVRQATAWLRSQYRDGDVIVHINYQGYLPSLWYNRQAIATTTGNTFGVPCIWESLPKAWCNSAPFNETYLDRERTTLPAVAGTAQRVWLVALYDPYIPGEMAKVYGEVSRIANTNYKEEQVESLFGVEVFLLIPSGSAS